MKITSEPFVEQVRDLLQACQSEGTFSKADVAHDIRSLGARYYPSLTAHDRINGGGLTDPHPMLEHILGLAFDITVDDWRGQEHINKLWDELTRTFADYSRGEWHQTEWYLVASFEHTRGADKGNTFSTLVYCEGGVFNIVCPVDEVRIAIENAAEHTPAQQTDIRRLENLARFMPEVDGCQLKSLELNERLKT